MKVHIRRAIWQGMAIVAVAGVAAVLTAKLHPRAPALYLTEDVTDELVASTAGAMAVTTTSSLKTAGCIWKSTLTCEPRVTAMPLLTSV